MSLFCDFRSQSDAYLIPHRTWSAFYNNISLDDFIERVVPKIRFKEKVHAEIKEVFKIIHKLLVHSYFEYLFLDIAVTKALHTFEMALKLRYKELNSGKEWKDNAPLKQLIDWFKDRNFFEINREDFFDHVRNVRNYLSHPKGHHFSGTASLHWIDTTVDLINDLYEDVPLRMERRELEMEVYGRVKYFIKDGARFQYCDQNLLIYDSGPVFINNKVKPVMCVIGLLPILERKDCGVKFPIILTSTMDNLKFDGSALRMEDAAGNEIRITTILEEAETQKISEYRRTLNSDGESQAQHSHFLFDIERFFLKTRREMRLV